MSNPPALVVDAVRKTYRNGVQALKGVSLTVEQGEFFALLGANGAGKTTLINIIVGLVFKDGGRVSVLGEDLDRRQEAVKRSIGVMPQEFNFNMFEKVEDVLMIQAGYYGVNRSSARSRAQKLLKDLSLWNQRRTVSRQLSGGMKRRLMLARALMHEPQVLILDEPTAGVDVELRFGMWDYLRDLNRKGLTIILTTHYLEEVEQLCGRAAMIQHGRIITCSTVDDLMLRVSSERYVVVVQSLEGLDRLQRFRPVVVNPHTFEVELDRNRDLHDFLSALARTPMRLVDFRPKGHRLERLFLDLVRSCAPASAAREVTP